MKIFGFDIRREVKDTQLEDVLQRIIAVQAGLSGGVTPESCMQSPTVNAIVTAVSRRLAVSPIKLYRRTTTDGLDAKEPLPSHPVAKLLNAPNDWQTRVSYWLDATSSLIRHGRYFAFIGRGMTGPIRFLQPIPATAVEIMQDSKFAVSFKVTSGGPQQVYPASKIHYVRGAARDFLRGDSPVTDVARSIALEIAAEAYGASFFDNGAMPLLVFKYMASSMGFKTAEAERKFIEDFQQQFGGSKRHRAMVLPKGMEEGTPIQIENDKAQMIESRRYQRTVIAGAFGVPPHLVGDLERATFNNVEQQDADFTLNVVLPVAQQFESAMEMDLLTQDDRNSGVVIRFNLDAILRADFKSRQEGLRIQRDAGVISPNEWREIEGRNPIDEGDGGDDYLRPANMLVAGDPVPAPAPVATAKPNGQATDNGDATSNQMPA
jgi:HK97 family phage portal protein